jgi:hypothetical protein
MSFSSILEFDNHSRVCWRWIKGHISANNSFYTIFFKWIQDFLIP